ncbi:hypothetical protein EIK77_003551 [Talaromyces pinophilus]|nr:hypothetical protein EIK77_003551 [Talaromyces pinophilus]PCG88424.1 Hypothetical protein PENO1_110310 [Penicillium occitanis (nom. inval.)]PCG88518.1 hypothetical protein PENOC_110650 [Penicillium occitanis (nom. inval.)]
MGSEFESAFIERSPKLQSFGESVDQHFLCDRHPMDGENTVFLVTRNEKDIHAFVRYVDRHGASQSSWLSRRTMHTILGAIKADRLIGEVFERERHPLPWATVAKPEVQPAEQQPEVTSKTMKANVPWLQPKTNAEDQCSQSKVANGTERLTDIIWNIRDPVEKARSVDGHPLSLDAKVFPSKVIFEFGDRYWDYSWTKCVTDTSLRGVLQSTKDEYQNYEANHEEEYPMGDGVWFTSVTYDEANDTWVVNLDPADLLSHAVVV